MSDPVEELVDAARGQRLVDDLVSVLDLERIERDIFRGQGPEVAMQRVFGGQVAGQALIAAGRTVDADRTVHSLHAYFILAGDPSIPIVYTVDRIRDGRSFNTRRVVATQHGRAIFSLSASFQIHEDGLEHQSPMPDCPPPSAIPVYVHRFQRADEDGQPRAPRFQFPFEQRIVPSTSSPDEGVNVVRPYLNWMKASGQLPDDPLLHQCALTYATDMNQLLTVVAHHGLSIGATSQVASLDHAVWFHRRFRADEWLLHAQESPSASGGRGLSMGRIFAEDGRHVATVIQEGMFRLG